MSVSPDPADGKRERLHGELFSADFSGQVSAKVVGEAADALVRATKQELVRAINKFAPFNSPHEGWAVIREELDELWEHVRADTARTPESRKEAIQIAAMALRFAYDLTEAPA